MNRDSIYTFLTGLLFGKQMDLTLFYDLLDTHQRMREAMRPWVVLQSEDSSQTVSTSTTFTTALTLPATFGKFNPLNAPIVLVDAQNNPIPLQEVPIADKYIYKDQMGKFYVDYANKQFFVCGTFTKSYTAHIYFVQAPTLVSAASGNVWIMDTFGQPGGQLLAHDIALAWKGIDYDIINNQNAQILTAKVAKMEDVMSKWDADLQNAQTRGQDPFAAGRSSWQAGQLPSGIFNP